MPDELGSIVNGSLWTINQEITSYLVIAILMALGLMRWWALALLAIATLPLMLEDYPTWWMWFQNFFYVFPSFAFGGAVFFLHRAYGLDGRVALACTVALGAAGFMGAFQQFFPLLASYPVLWLATTDRIRLPSMKRIGDISYGTYLYGWPIGMAVRSTLGEQATWWNVAGITLALAMLMGFVSWHLLEKHALRLKAMRIPWRSRWATAHLP